MTHHRKQTSIGGISWIALILGVGLGITIGLIYTWEIDPVVERNTAPSQLDAAGREHYVVAIALSYAHNRDLQLAFNRLLSVSPNQNVWQLVADIACDRLKTGKTVTNSDIRVIRALEQLYRPQGASGCADGQYPTPAPLVFETAIPTVSPTPSLTPPSTKTPTPPLPTNTRAPVSGPSPTPPPTGSFILGRLRPFCDPAVPGVIEVRVYDRLGNGIPGIPVTVTWGGNETDMFFTGLKPQQGLEYADFEMELGRSYSIVVPSLVSTVPTVQAEVCQATVAGESVTTTRSYQVSFQQQSN